MKVGNVLAALAFAGFMAWMILSRSTVAAVPTIEQARFSLAYGQAREALDFYTRCGGPGNHFGSVDERDAVVGQFAELRKAIDASPYQPLRKLVDMQQQVLSEDEKGVVRDRSICARLGNHGSQSRADVEAAIAGAAQIMRSGRS